ncbi:hypothetical protein RKD18_003780 [Streptomyces phaeoluteigriseus]
MTVDLTPATVCRPVSPVAVKRSVSPATAHRPVSPATAPYPVPSVATHRPVTVRAAVGPVTVSAAVGPVPVVAVLRPAPHQTFTAVAPFTPVAKATAAGTRRGSPLLAAQYGQRGVLSRPADQRGQGPNRPAGPRRRGFPGPVSARPTSTHRTPVPLCAQHSPRAIRERRSPR